MKIDAMSAAQSLLATRYPHAEVAYLGGSVTASAATATSDLDILVLMGPDQDDVSYVETTTHGGWLVEAFVYGPAAAKVLFETRSRAKAPGAGLARCLAGVPKIMSTRGLDR